MLQFGNKFKDHLRIICNNTSTYVIIKYFFLYGMVPDDSDDTGQLEFVLLNIFRIEVCFL